MKEQPQQTHTLPEPEDKEKRVRSFLDLLRLNDPLIYDPSNPGGILEDLAWRYAILAKDETGPVPITRLLSGDEIWEVHQIETGYQAFQRLVESWEIGPRTIKRAARMHARKQRQKARAKGGRAPKLRFGIKALVEALVHGVDRFPRPQDLWDYLELFNSSDPCLDVTGEGGERYYVYRDGDRLFEVRDRDGRERSIGFDAFRQTYFYPARRRASERKDDSEAE